MALRGRVPHGKKIVQLKIAFDGRLNVNAARVAVRMQGILRVVENADIRRDRDLLAVQEYFQTRLHVDS